MHPRIDLTKEGGRGRCSPIGTDAASSGKTSKSRIVFARGFWWLERHRSGTCTEITQVMRRAKYGVATIAKELAFSRRSFERIVAESLGIPPGMWLRQERMVAAAHMLREAKSVKQVAIEMGFRHQGDFGAEFKRWYGVNPADFKRKEVERNEPGGCSWTPWAGSLIEDMKVGAKT